MALLGTCSKGHGYIVADMYVDWPPEIPKCPICFREWQIRTDNLRVIAEKVIPAKYICWHSILYPNDPCDGEVRLDHGVFFCPKHGNPKDYISI